MTCSRSPCTFSSRVIGRSSHSGPLQGVVTLGTIGQMALVVSGHHCQHYSGSGQPSGPVPAILLRGHRPADLAWRFAALRWTLEPGGMLDAELGGLGAPEDLVHIDGRAAEHDCEIRYAVRS